MGVISQHILDKAKKDLEESTKRLEVLHKIKNMLNNKRDYLALKYKWIKLKKLKRGSYNEL